jgi:hypothetical protein
MHYHKTVLTKENFMKTDLFTCNRIPAQSAFTEIIVFILDLFNDAFTSSDYITSGDSVNNESETMWCKGVMAYFEVIASRNCGKQ